MKLLLIAFVIGSPSLFAATGKLPVGIKCEPMINDTLGAELCTQMRDAVARSPRYVEVDQNERGFEVEILTTTLKPNINTAASIVTSYNNLFLDHEIKICEANAIERCGTGFIATADDSIQTFRKDYAETHHQPLK